jgi:hypothetical protein
MQVEDAHCNKSARVKKHFQREPAKIVRVGIV